MTSQQHYQREGPSIRTVHPPAQAALASPTSPGADEEADFVNIYANISPYAGMTPLQHGYAQPNPSFSHGQLSQSSANGPQMYPIPTSASRTHLPGKQSVDAPDFAPEQDAISVQSHTPLHTPHMQSTGDMGGQSLTHRARFDSKQLTSTQSPTTGEIRPVDFAEKEKRSLPEGYQTPPSMSRASSGWGSFRPGKGQSPYGSLGGTAAKSDASLQFAEGDYGKTKFARFYLMIVSRNIVIRWLLFISPVLLLLWIPGICGVTLKPTPKVWGVSLVNWSIWLSILWLSWWAGMIVAMLAPHVLKHTIGTVAPEARHYIEYLFSLKKSITFCLWSLANWISFQPLILVQGPRDRNTGAGLTLSQITKGLFAIWLCSIILLIEKFIIQIIAYNFHKTSYADRIAENKFAVKSLVTLYLNSRDIGRTDTLDGGFRDKEKVDPRKFLKKGLKSAKRVVQGTSTALGTVASEIVGERVLQSNSPQSMVTSALASANKSRQLARRIFFSFTPSRRQELIISDIAPYFPNQEHLAQVFAIFDKDDNGDVSLEEIEMACLEIHRERLSLSSSMRDLDSAVGRLDQILMSLYYIVAILLFIGILSASFSGWITSASAFVLGLSWLIGSTAQEVLAAVVFLLAKHPYDVNDVIAIDGYEGCFVVKEIALLSTVFKKTDGNITQIPHTVLNTKAIQNYRRSGPVSEAIQWDVDYGTSFEQIESLRDKMMEFLHQEKRDYQIKCDISVASFNDQTKLSLKTVIPYKSNWSNDALRAQRRNKWICALKVAMSQVGMFGPAGAGNPSPAAADPTLIKFVNPEAAPPYRSSPSSANSGGSRQAAAAAMPIPLDSGRSGHPQPNSNTAPSPSVADAVNRLDFADRDARIRDEDADVYDFQGDANREDRLNIPQLQHAAETQVPRRNTALDSTPSAAGAALNHFRQQDLELGKLQSNK